MSWLDKAHNVVVCFNKWEFSGHGRGRVNFSGALWQSVRVANIKTAQSYRPAFAMLLLCYCRVVLSEAVDGCIFFTQKIQHGGDWERSRPQGPKNVHNFLMTVRPLSWACGHGTELLLILKKILLTWLLPIIFRYESPKKCPTILYAGNLWVKPVSAT